jgi:hypothetical protein
MNEQQRTYTMIESADLIGCKFSWLRDQVTARAVPHGRWGKRKGVFFTPDDLEEIINSRRRAAAARRPAVSAVPPLAADVEIPTEFASIRSARR